MSKLGEVTISTQVDVSVVCICGATLDISSITHDREDITIYLEAHACFTKEREVLKT